MRPSTGLRRSGWVVGLCGALAVGCAAPGAAVFAESPYLRPGATDWESVRTQSGPPAALNTYAQVLDRVVTHNPRVLSAWEGWRGRVEAVQVAGTPPRPELIYTLPLPVNPDQDGMHRLELRQMIPSPLSLVAQVDGAEARSDEGRHQYEQAVIEVSADVIGLLAELRYLQRALSLIDANERIADQLSSAADERLQSDAGTLFDVTRARSQRAQLHYDRIRMEELLTTAASRLNAALDLPVEREWPPLEPWPLATAPSSTEALYAMALRREPGLQALDSTIRTRIADVSDARGRFWPELMVGLMWERRPATMSATPSSGGSSDSLGLMLGLSLPLWGGADSARVEGAESALTQKVLEKKGALRALLADVQDAALRLRNARRLLVLYDNTLLPEAQRALADADAWTKARSAGFTDFLEARATFYQFSLARERAYADAVQSEARLRRLVGGTLDVQP